MAIRYPAEVFGFPVENRDAEAEAARQQRWCPFVDAQCNKKSRLVSYPMGVCSAHVNGQAVAICPRRFLERQTIFRDIALDYFGSINDLLMFSEVKLKGIGSFDYVLVRHKAMSSQVEDFVIIEVQTDQTTRCSTRVWQWNNGDSASTGFFRSTSLTIWCDAINLTSPPALQTRMCLLFMTLCGRPRHTRSLYKDLSLPA